MGTLEEDPGELLSAECSLSTSAFRAMDYYRGQDQLVADASQRLKIRSAYLRLPKLFMAIIDQTKKEAPLLKDLLDMKPLESIPESVDEGVIDELRSMVRVVLYDTVAASYLHRYGYRSQLLAEEALQDPEVLEVFDAGDRENPELVLHYVASAIERTYDAQLLRQLGFPDQNSTDQSGGVATPDGGQE